MDGTPKCIINQIANTINTMIPIKNTMLFLLIIRYMTAAANSIPKVTGNYVLNIRQIYAKYTPNIRQI